MKKYPIPGMVTGVIRLSDEAKWTNVAGFAKVDNIHANPDDWEGSAMSTDSIFRVGSITKTFTATLILKLDEADKLNLDDTVEQWLPGWVDDGNGITVRELLDMTSGLAEYATPEFNEFAVNHPKHQWSPRDLIRIAEGDDGRFKATGRARDRSHFRYRNTNYILLGAIAEKATGQSYPQLIHEHVTSPLNLNSTMVPQGTELPESGCHGYVLEKNRWQDTTFINQSFLWAAGSVTSTLDDMLKWTRMVTAGKDLGSAGWRQRLAVKPATRKRCEYLYGLGIEIKDGAVGHNGTSVGYESSCYRYGGYIYVAIANCALTTEKMPHVADALTDAMVEAVAGVPPQPCQQDARSGLASNENQPQATSTTLSQSQKKTWKTVRGGTGWARSPDFTHQSDVHALSAILHSGDTVLFRLRCRQMSGLVEDAALCVLRPAGSTSRVCHYDEEGGKGRGRWWITPADDAASPLPTKTRLKPGQSYDVYVRVRDNGQRDIEKAERLVTFTAAVGR